jgi:TonB-linked SusC/RagA family outer membrane protein
MNKKKQNKLQKKSFVSVFKVMITAILLLATSVIINAQTKLITGKVTDDHNGSLPGVTVTIKGSQTVIQTDSEGKYAIKAKTTDQLVFSFIGYETNTASVNSKSVVNAILQSTTTGLEEVVVVGYGTQKRKDVTGAMSKVAVNEIQMAPVRSFEEALAGRAAGVQVTSSDGQPGATSNIVIRGNNSVTQDNSPLYVIDGFLTENPDNNIINPKDIESIDILKDASATAIYGARGANGVIVITTKKGKSGAVEFNFDTSYGFQDNLKKIGLMNPYEFVKYQIELDPTPVSSTGYKSPTQIYLSDGKTLDYYKNIDAIDWQQKVTRKAAIKNYNLSIRGGNKDTKYAFSGSIADQDGIIINSNYTRYQARLVIDQNLTKKLKIGVNTNYSHLLQTGISPSQSTNSATTNVMVSVWGSRPVYNGAVPDDLQDSDVNPTNDYRVNPYLNLENIYRLRTTNNLNSNAYLEYLFLPGLKLRVTSGISENRVESGSFNNSNTQYGYPGSANGVNGSILNSQFSNWLNENTLTWNKKFSKKHTINAVAGYTMQKQTSKNYGTSANQIPIDKENLSLNSLDFGTKIRVDTFESIWTMSSFLGRINYNYASKYFLTTSLRADGSSKFPADNHWGYFPSAALSWKFSNEKFLKKSKILSDGKLRTSYGQTGNNRVGDFDYLTTYFNPIANSYVFNNEYVSGTVATNLGNSKLKWETTEQNDIGLDLGFFKQRITMTIDAYSKKTKDLLLKADLPLSSGFSTALKNIGMMQNQGLEFTLDTKNIETKVFTWSSSFNISFNKSKVLALNDNQENLQSTISWDNLWQNVPAYIAKVGKPIGEMYGYISDGTYKYEDFNKDVNGVYTLKPEVTTNGNIRNNIQPGDIKYKDINGDLVVNTSDYQTIGHGLPKNTGGFSNNFKYKGFDLNVFFQWSYGNDILNANRILFEGNTKNLIYFNQYASYENRWSPENPNSDIFRTKGYFGGGYASQFVEDGSFLRLKTISIGYNLDAKFLRKMNLKSMKIYCSGQNLATWTNYSGGDPEVNTYNSALTSGFDFSAYPRARVISFGTNITF